MFVTDSGLSNRLDTCKVIALANYILFFLIGVFLSGGNVMDREIARMVLMNPLLVHIDTVMLVSSSVMTGTALVPIFYVILYQIVLTDQMKIMYFVVCCT